MGGFNFYSFPAGGHGPFLSVGKIQGIGSNDESGWISEKDGTGGGFAVPTPSTLVMLLSGAGVAGMVGMRRRRLKAKGSAI
jgi:hypothetical protein